MAVIIGNGGVGERLKPAVLKTVRPERVSGVRIPPPPPVSLRVSLSGEDFARKPEFGGQICETCRARKSLSTPNANGSAIRSPVFSKKISMVPFERRIFHPSWSFAVLVGRVPYTNLPSYLPLRKTGKPRVNLSEETHKDRCCLRTSL
jgi:hypothetical protein